MLSAPLRRKVLILKDKTSIRNLLFLLKKIESENSTTVAVDPPLASRDQEQLEVLILDLRRPNRKTRDEVHGVGEIRLGRAGKLMVIVIGVNGPKTMDLLERYVRTGQPRALLGLLSHRYKSRQQLSRVAPTSLSDVCEPRRARL